MSFPGAWVTIILLAAAFRIWRLLAEDFILDRPRHWIVNLPRNWKEGDAIPKNYREKLAEFINCPWCFGFWISIAVWGLWQINEHWTEVLCVPLAISAGVGLVVHNLASEE
jgi:hypothetical protein